MFKILIADDDPELLKMLSLALTDYEVCLAHSGYQALELYSRGKHLGTPFDLLILDVAMLDMTGFQLEEAIRASGDSAARVVFLSGHFGGKAQLEVFKANVERATAVWAKPIEAGEFRELVKWVLGTSLG